MGTYDKNLPNEHAIWALVGKAYTIFAMHVGFMSTWITWRTCSIQVDCHLKRFLLFKILSIDIFLNAWPLLRSHIPSIIKLTVLKYVSGILSCLPSTLTFSRLSSCASLSRSRFLLNALPSIILSCSMALAIFHNFQCIIIIHFASSTLEDPLALTLFFKTLPHPTRTMTNHDHFS